MKQINMQKFLILYFAVIFTAGASLILIFTCTDSKAEENFQLNSDILIESAQLAGEYLIRTVKDTGRFIYMYDAQTDRINSSYNILRHAGTTYSMLSLYGITGDKELLSASERAIQYLLTCVKPYKNTSGIVFNNNLKTGGNALAVIALAEYTKTTGNRQYVPVMQNLCEYILLSQKENGEFISKRIYSTNEVTDFVSIYYPGESLLALCRMYSIDRNEK
jgi:hypothetical protein